MKRGRREVRLSRPGKIFVGLTLALGFAAVNTGNNVLFLLVSMMLALMVLSGFVAMANIWRVEVELPPQQILTAGEIGDVLIRIRNLRPWPLWLLELRLGASRQMVTRIAAHNEALVTLSWGPPCRGQPPLPSLQMGSAFPFAFVWRGLQIAPERTDLPWVAPASGVYAQANRDLGAHNPESGAPGGQGDFLWVRSWRQGESLQQIIWRRVDWSQNHQGFLHLPSREQEQAGQQQVLLDWESSHWRSFEPEPRLQVFRAALESAWSQGWGWQLQMPAAAVSGHGREQRTAALRLLAQHAPFPVLPTTLEPPGPWRRYWQQWRRALFRDKIIS